MPSESEFLWGVVIQPILTFLGIVLGGLIIYTLIPNFKWYLVKIWNTIWNVINSIGKTKQPPINNGGWASVADWRVDYVDEVSRYGMMEDLMEDLRNRSKKLEESKNEVIHIIKCSYCGVTSNYKNIKTYICKCCGAPIQN